MEGKLKLNKSKQHKKAPKVLLARCKLIKICAGFFNDIKIKFDTWGKPNVFNVEKNTDKPSTRTVRVRVCAYGVRASPTLIFISYPGTYSRIRSFVADMTPSERKRYSNFKVCIFFLFFNKPNNRQIKEK